MKALLPFVLLALWAGNLSAADLHADMTAEEFRAAGLNKLTSAELAALNAFLAKDPNLANDPNAPSTERAVTTAPALAPTTAPSESQPGWKPQAPEAAREVIVTRLQSAPSGGGKGTQFNLDNGQVWEQTDSVSVSNVSKDLRVRIKPAILGRWRMQFLANNTFIDVKRVR
jgi:hypothetical protein